MYVCIAQDTFEPSEEELYRTLPLSLRGYPFFIFGLGECLYWLVVGFV